MRITEAKFLQSAQGIADSPSPDRAEVAFLGRSNVGKSSLLNTLTNRKGLAKSSSTPGKTQLINYFEINFKTDNEELPYLYARFVDLPGFGYAKVSHSLKDEWQKNLNNYIHQRMSIRLFVHLIDSRHPFLQSDEEVHAYLQTILKPDQKLIRIFTKSDKLGQSEISVIKKNYPDALMVSSSAKKGIDKALELIFQSLFGENR